MRVLSAMIYGWFQAMILIHQMHDSCHSALGYSPAWWKFFGRLTQEWIAGMFLQILKNGEPTPLRLILIKVHQW